MILTALVEYYERLAAQGKVPAFGLTQEKVGYSILLNRDGKVKDVINLSDCADKKSKWTMLTVPASFKRSGIAPPPFFLQPPVVEYFQIRLENTQVARPATNYRTASRAYANSGDNVMNA